MATDTTTAPPTWRRSGYRERVLRDASGRALGIVASECRTWHAWTAASYVGEWLTRELAQEAVERALHLTPEASLA